MVEMCYPFLRRLIVRGASVPYILLDRFRGLFDGAVYRHRDSSLGDSVAACLSEDLFGLGLSQKLALRIPSGDRIINARNTVRGINARRGDGTFGERIPNTQAVFLPSFAVGRGQIATVEIGTEVKILAKAMIKQIDRVIGDLIKQAHQFRRAGGNPICVGIVGINYAAEYTSYERDKSWQTDGRRYKHPIQEAAEAERRLVAQAKSAFDEFLILRFGARNEPPYPFTWVDRNATQLDYGAALTRVLREYDRRF
jgi:hypothetical protein